MDIAGANRAGGPVQAMPAVDVTAFRAATVGERARPDCKLEVLPKLDKIFSNIGHMNPTTQVISWIREILY